MNSKIELYGFKDIKRNETETLKVFNSLFKRMGLSCKPNIILGSIIFDSISSKGEISSTFIQNIKEINVYYKGSIFSEKYSNKILHYDYPEDYDFSRDYDFHTTIFSELFLDFINTANISSIAKNEYIRYISESDVSSTGEIFTLKFVFVEYSKECLNGLKDLQFYIDVKDNLNDWSFDKNTNFVDDKLTNHGRNILNYFVNNNYDLYDIIHNLSLLKYESEENKGEIFFCNDLSIMDSFIELENKIQLNDTRNLRTIRKLLEISSENVFLLCDGDNIYGVGKISKRGILGKSTFSIRFKNQGCWELRNEANDIIMNVSYGVPSLPKQVINEKVLLEKCTEAFDLSSFNEKKLWHFIKTATMQKHGTMIVITDEAKSESSRLEENSFPIITNEIEDLDFIYGLTAIDGAVVLDPLGKCHSIGCILDGISVPKLGDNSRGARYNSAMRYINYCKKQNIKVLVVIISEDGIIDIKNKYDLPTPTLI